MMFEQKNELIEEWVAECERILAKLHNVQNTRYYLEAHMLLAGIGYTVSREQGGIQQLLSGLREVDVEGEQGTYRLLEFLHNAARTYSFGLFDKEYLAELGYRLEHRDIVNLLDDTVRADGKESLPNTTSES